MIAFSDRWQIQTRIITDITSAREETQAVLHDNPLANVAGATTMRAPPAAQHFRQLNVNHAAAADKPTDPTRLQARDGSDRRVDTPTDGPTDRTRRRLGGHVRRPVVLGVHHGWLSRDGAVLISCVASAVTAVCRGVCVVRLMHGHKRFRVSGRVL